MASVGAAMEKPKCDAMVISEMKIKDEKVEKANEHIIIGGENGRPKRRPDSLKVDAQDITGAKFEVNLTGLPARVFQHEFDHLQGILFFDRMSDEVLETIRADLQAMEKKYEERTGLPSPEKIVHTEGRKELDSASHDFTHA